MPLATPAAMAGERQADALTRFDLQLRPHLRQAFDIACTMLRDAQEAEDAVQEAAIKAWAHFDQFDGSSFRAWFMAIVVNQCRSTMRTRWWRLRRPEEPPEQHAPGHEERSVARLDLRRALDRLGAEQQVLLFLYFGLDLPQEEVAQVLGLRVGTVKSRLHRTVSRLREAMNEEDPAR